MNLLAVLEGILFLVGDDGLTFERAIEVLEIKTDIFEKLLTDLQNNYMKDDRGLRLDILGNRLKLTTKKEHKEYYEKLVETKDDSLLSQAALETLAIIAYNQPVTRVEVDEIRGISSSHLIRKLMSKNLIKDLGKSEAIGKPILYGVTEDFLDYFGLASIKELPKIAKIEVVKDEKNLFESKYCENE